MQTALEDTPGPVNVADARSGIRLGLVNGSLTTQLSLSLKSMALAFSPSVAGGDAAEHRS